MTVAELLSIKDTLADAIAWHIVRWLLMAEMPNISDELKEKNLSDLGFKPVEIVDRFYPKLGKSARRAKAKAVSGWLKK